MLAGSREAFTQTYREMLYLSVKLNGMFFCIWTAVTYSPGPQVPNFLTLFTLFISTMFLQQPHISTKHMAVIMFEARINYSRILIAKL